MEFEHITRGPVLLIVLQNAIFFPNLSDSKYYCECNDGIANCVANLLNCLFILCTETFLQFLAWSLPFYAREPVSFVRILHERLPQTYIDTVICFVIPV